MSFLLRLSLCSCFFVTGASNLLSQDKPSGVEPGAVGEAPASAVGEERKLKEQDELKLTVFGEDSLSAIAKIDSSGSVNFPLIGNVVVVGKTASEIAAIVESRLEADYIRDAHVTVSVVEEFKEKPKPVVVRAPASAPVRAAAPVVKASPVMGEVTLFGEIRRPGTLKFEGSSVNLLTALAQAGGFTPLANAKKVTIRRQVDGGNVEVLTVNAADLQTGTSQFLLQAGDTVSVAKRLF